MDTEAASGYFLPPSASTFCLVLQPALVRKWVETPTVEVDFTHSGLSGLGLLLVKSRRLSYVRRESERERGGSEMGSGGGGFPAVGRPRKGACVARNLHHDRLKHRMFMMMIYK